MTQRRNRFERLVDDLGALSRADVDGVNELALRLAGADRSNIKGAAFEAEVAVSRGTSNVKAIGNNNPHTRGEIDIETTDGRVIETKSGDFSGVSVGDARYQELESQMANYEQYTSVEGGSIEMVFRSEPSSDVKTLLDNRDIEWRTYE